MKPSDIINDKRQTIREIVAQFRVANPRIFGSVVHGTDNEDSDLDLLVDPVAGTTLFDLGGLQDKLESNLGISVDVRTPKDLPESFRQSVLTEARAL